MTIPLQNELYYTAIGPRKHLLDNMNRVLIFVALFVAGYARADSSTNSIDALAERLNSSNGLWLNGGAPIIEISSNATPKEVVSAAVAMWSLERGQIKTFRIVEARKIALRELPDCYAALLETDQGMKILLFRYEHGKRGLWWTRFFDATQDTEPRVPTNGASPPR